MVARQRGDQEQRARVLAAVPVGEAQQPAERLLVHHLGLDVEVELRLGVVPGHAPDHLQRGLGDARRRIEGRHRLQHHLPGLGRQVQRLEHALAHGVKGVVHGRTFRGRCRSQAPPASRRRAKACSENFKIQRIASLQVSSAPARVRLGSRGRQSARLRAGGEGAPSR